MPKPMRGPKPKIENPGLIFKRLMGIIMKKYGVLYGIVVVCIFLNVFATLQGTMFLKTLIDDFITPLLSQTTPDYGPLLQAMMKVAVFYGIGIVAAYLQNRLLITISQGSIKFIRDDLFDHMQDLPIRYFDTHSHGDIMSTYTNDIDTLRQLISQSLPQLVNYRNRCIRDDVHPFPSTYLGYHYHGAYNLVYHQEICRFLQPLLFGAAKGSWLPQRLR